MLRNGARISGFELEDINDEGEVLSGSVEINPTGVEVSIKGFGTRTWPDGGELIRLTNDGGTPVLEVHSDIKIARATHTINLESARAICLKCGEELTHFIKYDDGTSLVEAFGCKDCD